MSPLSCFAYLVMATFSGIMHHKTQIISKWFLEQDGEFTTLKGPPQLPELNQVEKLWDVLKGDIHIIDAHLTILQ